MATEGHGCMLIMTHYDSISFQNNKAIRFVSFKHQITLRGINTLFQSSGFILFYLFIYLFFCLLLKQIFTIMQLLITLRMSFF